MPDAVATTQQTGTQAATQQPDAVGVLDDAAVLAKLGDAGKTGETQTQAGTAQPQAGKKEGDGTSKDPPKPETPKESALLRSIQKRERDLITRTQEFNARATALESSVEAKVKAGIEAGLREAFGDPRALVKRASELGIKDQAIADALLSKDKASPEEIARRALEEAEKIRREQTTTSQQVADRQRESNFQTLAKSLSDKGELPHLFDEWTEAEVVREAYSLIAEVKAECQREGRAVPQVSDERLLRVLDKRAKSRQDRRTERQKAKGADATTKAASQEATKAGENGSGHQGGQAGASATTTLGKGLGERQTVAVPNPLAMSNEDIIAAANKLVSDGFTVKPH